MKRYFHVLLALTAMSLLPACGGSKGDPVTLGLDNKYCPVGSDASSLPDVLRIDKYRVTVSDTNGKDPFVTEIPGNAVSADVDGIPKGDNKTLIVEALNDRSQVICRRKLDGVSIQGGKLFPVELSLLAVPFIANMSNGNLITQTRLYFQGYGEPDGAIQIMDEFGGNETVLVDTATNNELVSPSSSTAVFTFKPAVLPKGEHTFKVRDFQTGQESEVTVTLVAPGGFPGKGITVTGKIDAMQTTSVGGGGSFSQALEALTK